MCGGIRDFHSFRPCLFYPATTAWTAKAFHFASHLCNLASKHFHLLIRKSEPNSQGDRVHSGSSRYNERKMYVLNVRKRFIHWSCSGTLCIWYPIRSLLNGRTLVNNCVFWPWFNKGTNFTNVHNTTDFKTKAGWTTLLNWGQEAQLNM